MHYTHTQRINLTNAKVHITAPSVLTHHPAHITPSFRGEPFRNFGWALQRQDQSHRDIRRWKFHRLRDHKICHIIIMVSDMWSIWTNRLPCTVVQDMVSQRFWDHDLDLLGSTDVIGNAIIGSGICGFLWVLRWNQYCIWHDCWDNVSNT